MTENISALLTPHLLECLRLRLVQQRRLHRVVLLERLPGRLPDSQKGPTKSALSTTQGFCCIRIEDGTASESHRRLELRPTEDCTVTSPTPSSVHPGLLILPQTSSSTRQCSLAAPHSSLIQPHRLPAIAILHCHALRPAQAGPVLGRAAHAQVEHEGRHCGIHERLHRAAHPWHANGTRGAAGSWQCDGEGAQGHEGGGEAAAEQQYQHQQRSADHETGSCPASTHAPALDGGDGDEGAGLWSGRGGRRRIRGSWPL